MLTTLRRRPLVCLFAFVASVLTITLCATLRSQAVPAPPPSEDALAARQQEQQARQQRLQDLDIKMKNPGMLLFRAAEFDPLRAAPPALRIGTAQLEMVQPPAVSRNAQTEMAQPSESAYLIVQFDAAIKPEETEALRARGYEIKAYVPHHAYIVKAPRTAQAQLLANRTRQFRWVGAYGAGLKVQPELAQIVTNSDAQKLEGEDELTISFTTFSGEKAERFKAALAGLNLRWPADVMERFDGVTAGRIVATRAEASTVIVTLANLEGVEWIEQAEKPKPENDNAVKIIQSGPNSTDTSLYRNGLTGAGQILGIADSGLDTDHAQFRLSADAAAQTLTYATTTQALVNGALPFQVTNPNNKVLTYYLLGIGSLIDNTNNPNGGKTLDPNEQTGSTYRNAVAYDDSNGYHGTHVVSVAVGRDYAANGSGAVPGIPTRTRDDGIAPEARLVFQDVGHPSGQLNGLSVGQSLLLQQAYNTGARIHSQSWGAGTNPSYNTQSADDDDAMWRLRDFNIFFSAGNSGPNSATITKDTKNGILVARTGTPTNTTDAENLISSSSHGPARDGRIKPDIAAPGFMRAATEASGIASSFTYQTSTTANDAAVNPATPNSNRDFSGLGGTSFSSPLVAGGATLVRQYFVDGYYPTGTRTTANGFNPSNALIKAIILNSGRNMTGSYTADNAPAAEKGALPNSGQGWGRMTLDDPLYFPGDRRELKILADIWNGATATETARPAPNPAITTGQTHTYQLTNVSTVEPLRISLVWADPKAAPGASVALINDLNLEVTDPTGKVYRGNVNFSNAYSQVAGTAAFDNRNPLEAVYIQYPNPGTYTVKVIGANVPGNGQMGIVA
ncbi:MAG TPA: S8 family serine peptidase, partial [Blastocatellia bacterium]|nr:S8 family serine peptidase [Blastocatellia bacterium]